MMVSRRDVLGLYRSLLRAASRFREEETRRVTWERVKASFREHKGEAEAEKVVTLVKEGRARLSFLEMSTPKTGGTGKQVYVFRDGKLESGAASGVPGRTLRAGIDADDLARHRYLLEKQHFMHRR